MSMKGWEMVIELKHCNKCSEDKPIDEFYKSTRGGCKECIRAYQNKWYQENRAVEKEQLPTGQRQCSKCHQIKPVMEFYRDKSNISGYHHHCKDCSNRMAKERLARKRTLIHGPWIPNNLKQCSKCLRILPKSDFYRLPSSKDGFRYSCKDCDIKYKQSKAGKASARKYRKKPSAKEKRNKRRREQRAEGNASWVQNELDYRKEYNQRDYVIESNREHNRRYRQKPSNKEKARQKTKEWREENPEQQREQARIKYLRKKGADGEHSPEQWEELVELCGGKCLACGGNGELTRDHIEPLINGGSDEIANIQPLCRKCNSEKHTWSTDYRSDHIKEWAEEQMKI